jgi:arylsulfatase
MDTTRADHLGCYGYARDTTPNIDLFAQDAVVFTNAMSVIPLTTPSHTSIMTGLHPQNHQVYRNSFPVHSNFTMMAEILKSEGYRTAGFVSVALIGSKIGFDQGFDHFSDIPEVTRRQRAVRDAREGEKKSSRSFQTLELKTQRRGDKTTDGALRWLGQTDSKPIFLWIHYYDPHLSYVPPDEYGYRFNPNYGRYLKSIRNPLFKSRAYEDQTGYVSKGEGGQDDRGEPVHVNAVLKLFMEMAGMGRREFLLPTKMSPQLVHDFIDAYDAEIAFMDDQIQRVFQYLENTGEYNNTIVILVGDHGEILYEKEDYFGHHKYLYEGSLRVPLLVRFPGVSARTIDNVIYNADILPTLLDGLGVESRVSMDGRSFWQLLEGKGSVQEQEHILYATHTGKSLRSKKTQTSSQFIRKMHMAMFRVYYRGIRRSIMKMFRLDRKWKIERHFDKMAVEKDGWKLIRSDTTGKRKGIRFELYNLNSDPSESRNLVDTEARRYRELKSLLHHYIREKRKRIVPLSEIERGKTEREDEIRTLRSLGYM